MYYMAYNIKNYSYKKAKEINVEIRPSKKKNKKLGHEFETHEKNIFC